MPFPLAIVVEDIVVDMPLGLRLLQILVGLLTYLGTWPFKKRAHQAILDQD